jgi:hypothetical protein
MANGKNGAMQALFRAISDDGTCWLFVVLSDDGWAITRNGDRVAVGANNGTSVNFGVRKFRALATAEVKARGTMPQIVGGCSVQQTS